MLLKHDLCHILALNKVHATIASGIIIGDFLPRIISSDVPFTWVK